MQFLHATGSRFTFSSKEKTVYIALIFKLAYKGLDHRAA